MFKTAADVFKYLDRFVNLEAGVKPPSMRPERMQIIAEAAGNPQNCAPAVHVAGSKGKGSITAMVSAMLAASGLRTARYLSPHIVDGRERITLDDEFFPDAVYARAGEKLFEIEKQLSSPSSPYYKELKKVSESEGGTALEPTYFELLTLFYFLTAKETNADILAIETGMGGRLDPTNICRSVFCIITGIELEHTDMLGGTIKKIAFEKAGIIKERTPVIVAAQEHTDGAQALEVFREAARERNAPFYYFPDFAELRNIKTDSSGTQFVLADKSGNFFNDALSLKIKLQGTIQSYNAAIAACAVSALRRHFISISDTTIQEGAAKVTLPARFEKITIGGGASDGGGIDFIVDGAHTELSVRHTVETWLSIYGRGAVLLFACAAGKDAAGMARILIPNFSRIIITMPGTYKPSEPEKVYQTFLECAAGQKTRVFLTKDTREAIRQAADAAKTAGKAVLAIGSFYLAAEIHKALGK